jgi:hypothetical protein
MKRIVVQVSEETATNLRALAARCADGHRRQEGFTSHGVLTVPITTTNARELYGLREGETVTEAIARSYDAMKADPSRSVTVDQVRQRLASEHAKKSG